MSLVTIDPEKCKKDGLCARICQKVFIQDSKGSVPVAAHEDSCNSCGHCVLVCPAGAIKQADCPPEHVHSNRHELLPTYEQIREMIVTRRSIRTFQDRPAAREIIEKIVDGSRFAPSAKNAQGTQFIVIQDKAFLHLLASKTAEWLGKTAMRLKNPLWRKLYLLFGEADAEQVTRWVNQFLSISRRMKEGADPILFNAPVLLLFHADRRDRFAEANANLAYQNASLIAPSLGIGGFYTGYLVTACRHDKSISGLLNLPEKHEVYAGFAFGHPKILFSKWIERNPPKITWM